MTAVVFSADMDPLVAPVHRLKFGTDIQPTQSRKEQRRSLRVNPSHLVEFTAAALSVDEKSFLDALIQQNSPDGYKVPWWFDRQTIRRNPGPEDFTGPAKYIIPCETIGRHFKSGEEVILWDSPFRFELLTVNEVFDDSITVLVPALLDWTPYHTLLMPVRKGFLLQTLNPVRLSRDSVSLPLVFSFSSEALASASTLGAGPDPDAPLPPGIGIEWALIAEQKVRFTLSSWSHWTEPASFEWDFGDGSGTVTTSVPTVDHQYPEGFVFNSADNGGNSWSFSMITKYTASVTVTDPVGTDSDATPPAGVWDRRFPFPGQFEYQENPGSSIGYPGLAGDHGGGLSRYEMMISPDSEYLERWGDPYGNFNRWFSISEIVGFTIHWAGSGGATVTFTGRLTDYGNASGSDSVTATFTD